MACLKFSFVTPDGVRFEFSFEGSAIEFAASVLALSAVYGLSYFLYCSYRFVLRVIR